MRSWRLGALVVMGSLLTAACVGSESGLTSGDDTPGTGNDGAGEGGAISDGGGGDAAVVVAPPTHAAESVGFVDVDLDTGTVGGRIRIAKAADESDVTSYAIYTVDGSGKKTSPTPLSTLSANGHDLVVDIPFGTVVQPGVTQIEVLSQNAIGEMTTGPATRYADAVVVARSLVGANDSGVTSTAYGRLALDPVNKKLLMIGANGLYLRCDYDGDNCLSASIAEGTLFSLPAAPAIDPKNGNVIFTSEYDWPSRQTTGGYSYMLPSGPLGDAGIERLVTDPSLHPSGMSPNVAVDAKRRMLEIVVNEGDTYYHNPAYVPVLYDCSLDDLTASCPKRDIWKGSAPSVPGPGSGYNPSVAIDETNGNVVVVSQDTQMLNVPFVLVCPNDGGACIGHDDQIGTQSAGVLPTVLVDPVTKKILIVGATNANSPYLTRCALDMSKCETTTEMTAGLAVGEKGIAQMHATLDAVEGRVVATGILTGGSGTMPALFSCKTDGS
ncbi:MAG TPA: hypothetical protein VF407_10020, partial [Polyangiaceae bacterium]